MTMNIEELRVFVDKARTIEHLLKLQLDPIYSTIPTFKEQIDSVRFCKLSSAVIRNVFPSYLLDSKFYVMDLPAGVFPLDDTQIAIIAKNHRLSNAEVLTSWADDQIIDVWTMALREHIDRHLRQSLLYAQYIPLVFVNKFHSTDDPPSSLTIDIETRSAHILANV